MSRRKKSRGQYGDGCVYLQGRIWWLTWHDTLVAETKADPAAAGKLRPHSTRPSEEKAAHHGGQASRSR